MSNLSPKVVFLFLIFPPNNKILEILRLQQSIILWAGQLLPCASCLCHHLRHEPRPLWHSGQQSYGRHHDLHHDYHHDLHHDFHHDLHYDLCHDLHHDLHHNYHDDQQVYIFGPVKSRPFTQSVHAFVGVGFVLGSILVQVCLTLCCRCCCCRCCCCCYCYCWDRCWC